MRATKLEKSEAIEIYRPAALSLLSMLGLACGGVEPELVVRSGH